MTPQQRDALKDKAVVMVNIPVRVSASLIKRTTEGRIFNGWAESGCPIIAPLPGEKMVLAKFHVEVLLGTKYPDYRNGLWRDAVEDCVEKLSSELTRRIEAALEAERTQKS